MLCFVIDVVVDVVVVDVVVGAVVIVCFVVEGFNVVVVLFVIVVKIGFWIGFLDGTSGIALSSFSLQQLPK